MSENIVLAAPCGPSDRIRVTSFFGMRHIDAQGNISSALQNHPGIDLRTHWLNTKWSKMHGLIFAPEDCEIIRIFNYKGYEGFDLKGLESGLFHRFGHVRMTYPNATAGTVLKRSDRIGMHGLYATRSYHLHYETHVNLDPASTIEGVRGNPVDPLQFLKLPQCDVNGNIIK